MIHTLHNNNLQLGQRTTLVARLHRILDITGFPVQAEDTVTSGKESKEAVLSFQKEFRIEPTNGIVTNATAKVLEDLYLESKNGIPHHITDYVIDKRTTGPVANAMVQVYESDHDGDILLDETTTNTKCIYTAAFDEMAYGFDEKLTPDLYFQVYYNDKLLLSTKEKVEKEDWLEIYESLKGIEDQHAPDFIILKIIGFPSTLVAPIAAFFGGLVGGPIGGIYGFFRGLFTGENIGESIAKDAEAAYNIGQTVTGGIVATILGLGTPFGKDQERNIIAAEQTEYLNQKITEIKKRH